MIGEHCSPHRGEHDYQTPSECSKGKKSHCSSPFPLCNFAISLLQKWTMVTPPPIALSIEKSTQARSQLAFAIPVADKFPLAAFPHVYKHQYNPIWLESYSRSHLTWDPTSARRNDLRHYQGLSCPLTIEEGEVGWPQVLELLTTLELTISHLLAQNFCQSEVVVLWEMGSLLLFFQPPRQNTPYDQPCRQCQKPPGKDPQLSQGHVEMRIIETADHYKTRTILFFTLSQMMVK